MSVRVVGVRHHSPACARVVRHVLDTTNPAVVLIEGPSDFNDRIAELSLPHRLPIAMFHFLTGPVGRVQAFTPFAATSPEWIALQWCFEHDVDVRFMDLPSGDKAFHYNENRFADRFDLYSEAMRALCERLGVDGSDAAWDHLFEQPDPADVVLERLDRFFAELRPDVPEPSPPAPTTPARTSWRAVSPPPPRKATWWRSAAGSTSLRSSVRGPPCRPSGRRRARSNPRRPPAPGSSPGRTSASMPSPATPPACRRQAGTRPSSRRAPSEAPPR
jgi:hypothetical protein